MKLAFCLFKFFPFGGLQRDFLRIARVCRDRGHEVHVFTREWEGDPESGLQLHYIKVAGALNHVRNRQFAEKVQRQLAAEQYDLVIGFNKMPHLDIYYAADVCYQARVAEVRSFFYRLLPRYRQLVALEKAVFAQGKQTDILLLSAVQQMEYSRYYQTEPARFHLLPPGIMKDRLAPANAASIREKVRKAYAIPPHHHLLLMVGSGFKTKGLDRAIKALAALPADVKASCHLLVIGQDNPRSFEKLARQLHVNERVRFLGGRSDVPEFLLAADLLLHPAYHENTGTVLLEAVVAGLPVLTVDVCGYAHYISEENTGVVLASPFQQQAFNAALEKMVLSSSGRAEWQQNGLNFARRADIYSLPEKAADFIEECGHKREITSAKRH